MKYITQKYRRVPFSAIVFACLSISFTLTIQSCENEVPGNLTNENKLVVLGEITAGDSARIPVARSLVVGNSNPVLFEKVNDALVSIISNTGSRSHLQLNKSPDFNENPAAMYSDPTLFHSNADYTLKISHPTLGEVRATAHIPEAFTVENVKRDESDLYGRDVLQFSFDIVDNANEKNYYIFEAVKELAHGLRYFYWQGKRYDYDTKAGKDLYETIEDDYDIELPVIKDTVSANKFIRLNVYTFDNNTGNSNIASLDSSFRRIFISDSLFNGQKYSSTFSIAMDHFEARNSKDKGIVKVQIKSVGKDFYNYMLEYEKYKTDFEKMPVGQLGSPSGNIQNGLGIFGGSFKREWRYFYDDFD